MKENISRSLISRRDVIKMGGLAAMGVTAASALSGCSTGSSSSTSAGTSTEGKTSSPTDGSADYIPAFLIAPAAITNIAETHDYDVVVVGAGASGCPAALRAADCGASVAVLQKSGTAVSQGNSGSAIDLKNSDPAGVEALVSKLLVDNQYRCKRYFLDLWAKKGDEAVPYVIDAAQKGGMSADNAFDQGNLQQKAILKVNGYAMSYITSFFGPKPLNTGDGMKAVATYAAQKGVEFYYSTPAQQLVQDANGKVTGVIGMDKDGNYIQLNARNGVILACGDYQNNQEMRDYYVPDLKYFEPKQDMKTGDGHLMGVWAGGVLEPIGHTKMLHDFDAGPASMCDYPFLNVDENAKRFCDETVAMSLLNNFLKQEDKTGWYTQIFDSDYMTFAADWKFGKLVDPSGLENYMPDVSGDKTGVFPELIRTFKADTIEELAGKLEIDATQLKKTIDNYNAMCTAGADTEFGKSATYMHPVVTAPFYGIHRHIRISACCSGLSVNEDFNVLDGEDNPIEGLYAVGINAGYFYSGVDYPLTVFGLNLGHCYTFGYLVGESLATGTPVSEM